jgi:hypothetical protein
MLPLLLLEVGVLSELKIILRETTTGRESTPWLDPQRDKFTRVARECKEEFKDSKLKGEAKIRAMNTFMSRRLRDPDRP